MMGIKKDNHEQGGHRMIESIFNERYRLDDKIGEGGMATVFSGTDTLLRRRVAIKVLRPQYAADEDFVQRFYTEARHAAKLSHPNVVNIYDVGRQDDTYFIVMELVEGATLAEMIEADRRIPEPVAIDYAAQICNGLAYAHRQGILHRDIKPANILVTQDDVVKLSDFGIARAVSQHTMSMTQPGMVMGSVHYLSPEQAQGHEMHETSDLYSLGIVLYQMLTGRLPYTGDSPISVAVKHVSGPVPIIDPTDDQISPALAAIVRKLLQKDPGSRFTSATEVASVLREAREHPLQAVVAADDASSADAATKYMERVAVPQPPPRRSKFPDVPAGSAKLRETGKTTNGHVQDETRATERVVESTPSTQSVRYPLLALLLAASILIGFAIVRASVSLFNHTPVHIADYIGMQQDLAEAALAKLGLYAHVTQVTSERIASGRIVAQQPTAGSTVPAHSTLELLVSIGLPIVEVTDLRSFSREDAERYLRNAKLTPKFTEKYDRAPHGTVIAQEPLPGTRVVAHSVITLLVSKGLLPVATPDIVSLTLDDAINTLRARKLDLNIINHIPSDDIPQNVVASQDPKPGTDVEPGTKIGVVISMGPAEIIVPDVGGRSFEDAMNTMRNAGLLPHIVYLPQTDIAAGTVVDQTPPASSTLRRGDTVTLTIAVPGIVPSVAGMALEEAKKALANAGYTVGNTAYTQAGVEGKVVRTEPEAGASLRPGEAVTIYYNTPAH
jgi:eukaryotic-like serine/threonine-protein kinase